LSETLLEVDDISLFRGQRCLFVGLGFTLSAGQVLQLVGDNGSGKTSLLRALCTLLPVETGSLAWRGKTLPTGRDDYLTELCYSGHADSIKLDLTARENLAFYAALGSRREGSISERISQVIEQVGLTRQADLPCRMLSAGQRRRVTLSRLLIRDAALWLLDEPLTALDVRGRTLVSELIARHVSAGGAVIFTTHQPLELPGVTVEVLDLNDRVSDETWDDYVEAQV
jgi:heme exporter protein A